MAFSEDILKLIWNRAQIVQGYDPSVFRKDPCGAWMIFNKYGLRDNDYGWEIDHVFPTSLGGDDDIKNLRAMNWQNNASKADDYPSYIARVTSDGNKNIPCYISHTVNYSLRSYISEKYNR